MQNITRPALLALRLPLPSIEVQRKLAARKRIDAKRAAAAKLAAVMARVVEEMILGRAAVPRAWSPGFLLGKSLSSWKRGFWSVLLTGGMAEIVCADAGAKSRFLVIFAFVTC